MTIKKRGKKLIPQISKGYECMDCAHLLDYDEDQEGMWFICGLEDKGIKSSNLLECPFKRVAGISEQWRKFMKGKRGFYWSQKYQRLRAYQKKKIKRRQQ